MNTVKNTTALAATISTVIALTLATAGCGNKGHASEPPQKQAVASPGAEKQITATDTNSTVQKKDETTQLPAQDQKDVTPDEVSSHRILYQEGIDATIVKDGKPVTERIAVYGVAGARFPAGNIELDRRAKLSRTVITIEDARGGFLIPQKDSAVPINMGFDQSQKFGISFFTHAINVTWNFAKPGIRFAAGDSIYESERAGASVSFTEEGAKIDGLKKTASQANVPQETSAIGSTESAIRGYDIGFKVQPSILGGKPGRYNFATPYKDAVMFGNGVKLDIAYVSTLMQVNGKDGVLHYGLRAEPSEITLAQSFAKAYEKHKPGIKMDRIILSSEPDPDIILLRKTADGFVPVSRYEVKKN